MELFLSIGQFLVAIAMAIFTFQLTKYTKELAKYTKELVNAQRASNKVLKQQTELMNRQTQLQKAQQQLQQQLAESEVRPLLALQAEPHGPLRLTLTNLGRYGVMVEKLKQYQEKPSAPNSHSAVGTPAGSGKQRFPIPLPSGKKETLEESEFSPSNGEWVEVIYLDGASGRRRSDLWQYTGQSRGFVRKWWAREVLQEQQEQGRPR